MTDRIELKNCNDDDILSFDDEICKLSKFRKNLLQSFYYSAMYMIGNLIQRLKVINLPVNNQCKEWFNSGKECELLKEGKKWQKGKLRIQLTLEFVPDESIEENDDQEIDNIIESPLDEIRQQLTDNND
jgi:hypothetical protein